MATKQPNVKILVGYHKPAVLLKSDVLVPIHLGRALATQASKDGAMSEEDYQWMCDNMIGDDTGDNISSRNRSFAELTALYWAWKNYDKLGNPDYIGFMHYRRYFDVKSITDYLSQDVDIIVPEAYHHKESVQEQFCTFHNKDFLDIILSKIQKNSSNLSTFSEKFFNGNYQYLCNIFVMKKKYFMEYIQWLFSIVFDIDKEIDYSKVSTYNYRVPAFCAERLTSLWIENKKENKSSIKELPYIFKDTNSDWLVPVDNKNSQNIPIVLAADDNYTYYVGVCITSILENADKKHNYDFYIIGEGLNDENKEKLRLILSSYNNASLRIVNISSLLEKYDKKIFYSGISGDYNISTYYRFFLADIFKNFNKILYIDSDTIVLNDISKLYNVNIKNNYVAATKDIYVKVWRRIDNEMENYLQTKLKLRIIDDYFQAGVLLINIALFNKDNIKDSLFDKLQEIKYPKIVDQDILNSILKDKIMYISNQWDYDCNLENMVNANPNILINNLYIDEMNDYILAKKNPYIIHYAGKNKPWFNPKVKFASFWWKYARMTPFYEEIIYKNLSQNNNTPQFSNISSQFIKDVALRNKNFIKYWKYKILSKITFGKKRKKYKQKRKDLKARLKAVRQFLKG